MLESLLTALSVLTGLFVFIVCSSAVGLWEASLIGLAAFLVTGAVMYSIKSVVESTRRRRLEPLIVDRTVYADI